MIGRFRQGRCGDDDIETPEYISISYDKLLNLLRSYDQGIKDSYGWLAYLGIALTLAITLGLTPVSKDTKTLFISAADWRIIFIFALAWSAIQSLRGGWHYIRRPKFDRLMSDLVAKSEASKEIRALCIIKRRDLNHEFRILVYYDQVWKCWLLPHVSVPGLKEEARNDLAVDYISNTLGVDRSNIVARYIEGADLRTRKHSEYYRSTTVYTFYMHIVQFDPPGAYPVEMFASQFTHSGCKFAWMTLNEMEADVRTRERNLDVTRHLADRIQRVFVEPPDSVDVQPGPVAIVPSTNELKTAK